MDRLIINNHVFASSVALTLEEQARGLMFEIQPQVMVFPFEKAAVHKFWMKNTFIPLDLLFCYRGKVAHIEYGKPFSEQHLGPNYPVDMVVELPYGTVQTVGFTVGSSVKLILSTETLAKKFALKLENS